MALWGLMQSDTLSFERKILGITFQKDHCLCATFAKARRL